MASLEYPTSNSPNPVDKTWTEEADKLYELGQINSRQADIMSGISRLDIGVEITPVTPQSTTKTKRRIPMSNRRTMYVDIGSAASEHKSFPEGHKPFED